MKSFIFSTIIFFILLLLVFTNSLYIHIISNKMINIANIISISDTDKIEDLSSIWQKHRLLFGISIHDSHIERITELIENIKSAATIGDDAEFHKSLNLLSELLDELKKNEEISFQGII